MVEPYSLLSLEESGDIMPDIWETTSTLSYAKIDTTKL